MDLSGKVAVITGGASGLGWAVAQRFSGEGAVVVIADIGDGAPKAAEELRANGCEAVHIQTDVTKRLSVKDMVEKVTALYGRIDILINAAGIYPNCNFLEIDDEKWDRIFQINLRSVYYLCQAVLPVMMQNGGGKVVNIASTSFDEGPATLAHYVATKAGVIGLTRSMAREFAGYNININAVSPGMFLSQTFLKNRPRELIELLVQSQAFKRPAYPRDIVGPIRFLVSEDAAWMTGQTLNVDGGFNLK